MNDAVALHILFKGFESCCVKPSELREINAALNHVANRLAPQPPKEEPPTEKPQTE